MKIYWFSFSFEGKNNGVCVVEAMTPEEGEDKIENLKLLPDYDDIYCCEMEDMSGDPKIEFNILYSPEEMIEKGYVLIQE